MPTATAQSLIHGAYPDEPPQAGDYILDVALAARTGSIQARYAPDTKKWHDIQRPDKALGEGPHISLATSAAPWVITHWRLLRATS